MRRLTHPILLALALGACGENQTPAGTIDPPTVFTCLPDRDGAITAAELPVALGVTVDYLASPAGATRTVDLVGTGAGDAHRWDLSAERADDVAVSITAAPLNAQWYAASFPGAAFVVDAGNGLDGIYREDDTALWLYGLASHDAAPASGKTLLPYAAPVAVLRFPIADGDAHHEVGQITAGTASGLPFIGTDTYDIDVTGTGRLDLPYVRFSPALRVRTHVVRAPAAGGTTIGRRQTQFLFECFGEVARAESRTDEPNPDFTMAAYLRRYAL
jgi:hypothetical protein